MWWSHDCLGSFLESKMQLPINRKSSWASPKSKETEEASSGYFHQSEESSKMERTSQSITEIGYHWWYHGILDELEDDSNKIQSLISFS